MPIKPIKPRRRRCPNCGYGCVWSEDDEVWRCNYKKCGYTFRDYRCSNCGKDRSIRQGTDSWLCNHCEDTWPITSRKHQSPEERFIQRSSWLKDWHTKEMQDLSWLDPLPDCPCCLVKGRTKPQNPNSAIWTQPDNPGHLEKYHPGAAWEIRSEKAYNNAGQQCCYDSNLQLIRDYPGAGTPDKKSAIEHCIQHQSTDVTPYNRAKYCDEYLAAIEKEAYYVPPMFNYVRDYYFTARPPNTGDSKVGARKIMLPIMSGQK